jgi:hypothetical protein
MMVKRKVLFLALLAAGALSSSAQVLTIDLPDISLQPNLAGQTFTIDLAGDPTAHVITLVMNLQVGSQPDPNSPNFDSGPKIQGIDLVTGTGFEGNVLNTGGGPIFDSPSSQLWESDVRANSEFTEPVAGKHLATVTISTVGFSSGAFNYTIATENGGVTFGRTTGFSDVDAVLTGGPGTLTIVPEPSTYAAAFGFACICWGVWSRRSRRQV